MSIHLEAVYDNGVFRPLQPVHLPERLCTFIPEIVKLGSVGGYLRCPTCRFRHVPK